ncbi:intestinal mucin-like protein [Hypomesus transpacificus]|uniref:intestinal mucin-like protein n=1 Tax=Hypomesus transpacificus TaxID=137520 RepID=UPI001F07F800|nr:intestinal mucin-like protein [Hypomesus transpacificus]
MLTSTITTTTSVPSTSILGTTTIVVETTTQAETTTEAIVSTSTVPPKVETTGPTTAATTVFVETSSTEQPSTASSGSTSTAAQTTTKCFCIADGKIYQQGDLVYNVTDEAGWCYTAHCNSSCQVEVKSTPCPSTAPPTSTTTQYSTSSETLPTTPSEASPTSPASSTPSHTFDCSKLQPPRKEGDIWEVNNCTSATCVSGKVIELPVSCPPVTTPSCENGRPPVKVFDTTGCCYQYECECVCSVWGESHYLTFDGQSYNFHQNCSYYLVKEILPKYNLSIVVDNNYCAASGSSFCPQSLIISYQSSQIVMTQLNSDNTITNVVYVNQKRVYPPYSKDGLDLTSTGMELTLSIPAILAQVVYKGSFSINLPYSLFHGNTEGQCGTCDNSKDNDCRSPNGQMQNCGTSAPEWQVSDKDCVTPPTTVPPTTSASSSTSASPASTPAPCRPAICDIMNSKVFEPCHISVPPNAFIEACRSDVCSGANNSCSSLEAYASECSKAGICIDWRNATNGQCVHICPSAKVYMPCGPVVQPTCSSGMRLLSTNASSATTEGCFCPSGTTLFSSYSDTCVPSCDCTGPDGQPKQYGETWTSGCKQCTCDKGSMSVQCQPIPCLPTTNMTCSEPGFKLVTKTVDCCLNYTCECDILLCPASMVVCKPGFEAIISTDTTCCPTTQCVPKGVCVYNNVEYKPGSKVPSESCEECTCGPTVDPMTQLNNITCTPITCQTNCSQGYEYQTVVGQCCGKCVQTSCVVILSDNTTHIVQLNETWSPPKDKCLKYTCEINNGQHIPKLTETMCPAFTPENCIPGTETTDANGCCRTCTPRSVCEVQTSSAHLVMKGCNSTLPVEITSCAGACQTSSIYSMEANVVMHQCSCCQEASTSQRQVELKCGDGSTVTHTYIHINTCSCHVTDCQEGATAAPTSSKQRRRRR